MAEENRVTTIVNFHEWKFRAEVNETQKAYSSDLLKGAEACICSYCRNLVAQREKEYPLELCAFLEAVGVNPFKEAEVWSVGPVKDGLFFSVGYWYFVAEVEEEGDSEFKIYPNKEGENRNWNLAITPGETTWMCKALPESPIVQIEYNVHLPWVLSEAHPE